MMLLLTYYIITIALLILLRPGAGEFLIFEFHAHSLANAAIAE